MGAAKTPRRQAAKVFLEMGLQLTYFNLGGFVKFSK
jgi:hypothetical protein